MPGITLADIRTAADEKYGPYVVSGVPGGDVTLVSAVRLSRDARKKLVALQEQQTDGEADQDALLREMVTIVAESPEAAQRLLDAIGDDNAQLAVLLEAYGEASQLGDRSASPS